MDKQVNPEAEAHAYVMRELIKTQAWDLLKMYADRLADDWMKRLTDPEQEAHALRVYQGVLQGIKQVMELPEAIIAHGSTRVDQFPGLKRPLILQ